MADQVENFRELYSTTLVPKLTELDKTRKSILDLIKKHILISLVPLGIFGYISVLYETPIPNLPKGAQMSIGIITQPEFLAPLKINPADKLKFIEIFGLKTSFILNFNSLEYE